MFEDKLEFKQALLQAQQLGFAESNPALDIEGYDAVNKWVLLLNHAYGIVETIQNILFNGIQNIQLGDAMVAKVPNQAGCPGLIERKGCLRTAVVKHDDHSACENE